MSEISFPIKDIVRRKTQTTLTVFGLATATTTTIFLILFGSNLGFDISLIHRGGELTSGFAAVFSQFILFVSVLNLVTGPIITSFLVHLAMSGRMKDIGVMKASGCLTVSIFGYFVTELSIIILVSTAIGITLGICIYYIVAISLSAIGFQISAAINPWTILLVSVITIIASHVFGAKPIQKAANAKPTEAMSPMFALQTTANSIQNISSRLGFAFKVAYRTTSRRKTMTKQAIICLSVVLTLTTVSLSGGIIANQTTNSYTEKAIGQNVVMLGHPKITERYVTLLSRFFEEKETTEPDYLNSDYLVSDSLIAQLEQIDGIIKIDPRLIMENSVREIPGLVLDPVEQDKFIMVGGTRSDDALILGVDPEKVVNNWLIFGNQLDSTDQISALIGDTLAANMFSYPRNQSIKIIEETSINPNIVGICVDPLNNGKVVYLPLKTLYEIVNQKGYNLIFIQTDPSKNQKVITQIEELVSADNLSVIELDTTLDKHINFLNNIWSLVMFLPMLSLGTATISFFNYIMLSISEQQLDFSIMKALGAKSKKLIKIVFLQALLIITVSGTAGISVGLFFTFNFLIPYPIIDQHSLASIVTWLIATLAILSTTCIFPAWSAIKKPLNEML